GLVEDAALAAGRLAQVARLVADQVGVLTPLLPEQVIEHGRRDLGLLGHLLESGPGALTDLVDIALGDEARAERQAHQDVVRGDLPAFWVGDGEPASPLPDLADEEGLLPEWVGECIEL